MTEDYQERSVATNFVCGYCRRKFTKKEHLKRHERAHTGAKPFKCTICNRSFSRGDVLTRHVKGHRAAAQPRDPSNCSADQASLNFFSDSCGDGSNPADNTNRVFDSASEGNRHRMSHDFWHAPQSENQILQQDASSSLLWPGSEELFQTLISGEGMSWDQSVSGLIPGPELPQDASSGRQRNEENLSRDDELAIVEDGHRAVQTINGLLTNTIFNVTSHVELSGLTPRFLDSSLHMFFTKFVPILPVIHRPTFIYRDCSAPLLLNAIALGSLFLGTEDASTKGEALWRLAYTAIATSWSGMIGHRREHDICSGVELVMTALLSQAYAALSKNRELRMTSQTFYGLSMHWAQYCGLYDTGPCWPDNARLPQMSDSVETKMHAWRSWAARETQLRTLLGLCVIDGVVSQFSGNLVNTWLATKSLPLAVDENTFAAESVDKWIEAMSRTYGQGRSAAAIRERFHDLYHSLFSHQAQLVQDHNCLGLLNIKILLEVLASLAIDVERTTRGRDGAKPDALRALGSLRQTISQSNRLSVADKAIGLLRWHSVCLDLVASTARGARRMCHHHSITQHIFGGRKRQEPGQIDPESWLQGVSARKCLLHALEIHKIASEVPLGVIHDTCLPGALFAAATTYSSFALPGTSKLVVPPSVDWDTVLLYAKDDTSDHPLSEACAEGADTLAFFQNNINTTPTSWVARNLLYELGSIRILLHSLSQHWGVAKEMEEVIGAWEARCN